MPETTQTLSGLSSSAIHAAEAPAAGETISRLDANWRQWMAENALLGCRPDSVVDRVAENGIPLEAARREFIQIVQDPIYQAAEKFIGLKRKLESVLDNYQAVWEAAPDYAVIPRRSGLDRETFFHEHYITARPAIITDVCRDWPAMHRWQLSELAKRFADCEVEIQAERDSDTKYELNSIKLKKRVRFGDFMDQVLAGGPSNNVYMTANNHVFRNPAFTSMCDDVGQMPDYLDPSQLASRAHLWIGPQGTRTPLHHDTCMLLHAQIVGRKRWRLVSPLQTARIYNYRAVFSPVDLDAVDLERFPLMRGVRVLEVVVEPGEALFLPLAWWHQVTSLDPCVSISLTNLAFPNDFNYYSPSFGDW
jgi:hypothetical protein